MKILVGLIITFACVNAISAAVPNRSAVVTAVSTASAKCGAVASTRVHGNYTNNALQNMGISSISMSGPIVFNTDLSANPPHTGKGDGEATITQTGVCSVVSDSQGNVITTPSYTSTSSTKACSNGE